MIAAEGLSVQLACQVVCVSESGYYDWCKRPASARSLRHIWLTELIAQIHADSRGTYGARRVHAELTLGRGIEVGRQAIEMEHLVDLAFAGFLSHRPPAIMSIGSFIATSRIGYGSRTSPSTRVEKGRYTAL